MPSRFQGGGIFTTPAFAQDKVTVKVNEIYSESSLLFENLTSATGGAFDNRSEATINEFIFNKNTGTTAGGAVFNGTNAVLNVINSDFTNNQFTNKSSRGGGAIYNQGMLAISGDSEFNNNVSNYSGGAIYNFTGSTITIEGNTKFTENSAAYYGGAIYNSAGYIDITNAEFNSNTTRYGGAIYNNKGNIDIADSYFTNNNGENNGGAIYNTGKISIDKTEFQGNETTRYGGAVYMDTSSNKTAGITTITNSTFINNTAVNADTLQGFGGAITLAYGNIEISDNTVFEGNKADGGGAISIMVPLLAQGETVDEISIAITDSVFTNNTAGYQGGGAIHNCSKLFAENITFKENHAETDNTGGGGGALFLGSDSETVLNNVIFDGNTSETRGGAIATRRSIHGVNDDAKVNIYNSQFINNTAVTNGGAIDNFHYGSADEAAVLIVNTLFENNKAANGGAIYNNKAEENARDGAQDGAIKIVNSIFKENQSTENGGAVYNEADAVFTDSSFINNTAGNYGGAIYSETDITINAENTDIIFSGNIASDGSDIYMSSANSTLNINAAQDKTITFDGGISGNNNTYNILINPDSTNTGSVIIKSAIDNALINVQNGMLHLAEGSSLNNTGINMASGTTLNTINNKIDTFGNNVFLNDNVNLLVDVNISERTSDNFSKVIQSGNVTIEDINLIGLPSDYNKSVTIDLAETMGLKNLDLGVNVSDYLLEQEIKILTPIRYMQGSIDSNAILSYGPTGNSYNDFNPAVMASSVAAQLGGYLTQLNSYDEAFRNMDMYMLMTKKQRQALKYANKYAASDAGLIFDPISTPYTDKSGWFRPYATFESVGLKNGPKVSNVAYGTFAGVESEMYDLGNGWDGIISLYAGYNGSHQAYQGNSIYQNGGTLGLVGMAYKGNFFTGLTTNVGANVAEANTMYRNEDFSMLMTGIASKTGYNFEMADGKFIIQPNYLMSYSFINTFDYTNAAGVRINSDPLHAIQIEPGVKLIGNLNNGWQPYGGVSVVLNIMDKTQFKANDVSLPDLSVKPFVKYGLGIRKTWGERFTGFFQTYLTSGGRNGVGIQAGFRWTLGKSETKKANSENKKKDNKEQA